MAPSRNLYGIAVAAAERIRKAWRTGKAHKDAHLYHQPQIDIHPGTYEIVSNMIDGLPPRR